MNCADCGSSETFTSALYSDIENQVIIVLYCSDCTWHVTNSSDATDPGETHGYIEGDGFDMITR